MGLVTDIKQALRSVNALRISYFLPDLSRSVERILPPDSDREIVMRAVPLKISEAEPRSLPHKK